MLNHYRQLTWREKYFPAATCLDAGPAFKTRPQDPAPQCYNRPSPHLRSSHATSPREAARRVLQLHRLSLRWSTEHHVGNSAVPGTNGFPGLPASTDLYPNQPPANLEPHTVHPRELKYASASSQLQVVSPQKHHWSFWLLLGEVLLKIGAVWLQNHLIFVII